MEAQWHNPLALVFHQQNALLLPDHQKPGLPGHTRGLGHRIQGDPDLRFLGRLQQNLRPGEAEVFLSSVHRTGQGGQEQQVFKLEGLSQIAVSLAQRRCPAIPKKDTKPNCSPSWSMKRSAHTTTMQNNRCENLLSQERCLSKTDRSRGPKLRLS